MKRINITKINFIFYLFLLLIAIFCCFHETFAVEKSEKISLVSNINNVYNNVTNIYTYKLEAKDEMAKSVFKEPVYYEVKYNNVTPNNENIATVNFDIDFSKTNFEKLGYYKFIISEVDSSDKNTFPISDKKFEITVSVTNSEGNKYEVKTISQVVDLDTNEKTSLKFEHRPVMTHVSENFDIAITGVFINVIPFVILIIFAVIGIIYLIRNKRKKDDE